MFSLNRTIFAATVTGLSLALLAGCKTSETKSNAILAAPPQVLTPNRPAPPPVNKQEDSADSMLPNILTWDATAKTYNAKSGETRAPFTFSFTNVSRGPVVIYDTATSCDCTVASLPTKPWTVPSGESGKVEAAIDLKNKVGTVTNYVIVFTSQGNRRLSVKAIVPTK